MKRAALSLLILLMVLISVGCHSDTEVVIPVPDGADNEVVTATAVPETMTPDKADADEPEENTCDMLMEVVDRVGVKNAYPWVNTVDFEKSSEALIKLAEDETGEYAVYGIISREYGTYGLLMNDVIDGENNFNIEHTEWYYSGVPEEQPILETDMHGEYTISYVYKYENGTPCWKKCILDCGYDTGHMKLVPAE